MTRGAGLASGCGCERGAVCAAACVLVCGAAQRIFEEHVMKQRSSEGPAAGLGKGRQYR